MSSSPPVLPISNPVSSSSSSSESSSQAPIATPAFKSFLNRLADTGRTALSQRRPWSEVLDRSAFSRPESLSEASSRLRKNLSYFRLNYLLLLGSVLGLSLLSHPLSLLLLLSLLSAWSFLYLFRPSDPPLVLLGRTFSDRETLALLSLLSAFVLFLTSVGSLLISALLLGFAIVSAHGAFRVPEDLFLDDQEPAAVGFLSFLGGAASSAAASPAVVAATAAARV